VKKLIVTLIVTLLVASVTGIHAQTLKDVLDRHFKTIGQEKLTAVKTYSVKATVSQMGMELPMEMKMKRPNKFRMEMEMQGQKMIQVYDGEKGWIIAPWVSPEPQELEGAQLQQALDQADIDGELYNYVQKGHKAELIGKEQQDGMEVYNIKLTTKNGDVKNYYIDADKYLIVKAKAIVNAMGQEVEVVQRMSDYKNIDGVLMATTIESETPMGTGRVILSEIKFNQDIDDAIFKQPAK
jgi:outer membrane lipoprotein-sorting protein